MATSDVLQFHYCTENEDVRNATKNFAGILGDAFEQYKKLWIEYIKLQKYCENAGVKIPFQVFKSKSDNSNIVLPKAESCIDVYSNQTSQLSKNSTTYNLDNTLGSNETILADDKFGHNKLLHSPVLIRRHKPKKNSITPGRSILDDTDEIDTSIPLRENIIILANSSDEDLSTSVETKENQCSNILNNNDEIECTPLSRLPKKLGLSKLYNIETTLLNSGKKLKQSRLAFVPSEENKMIMDAKKRKKLNKLIQPEFLTSTKNLQQNSKGTGSNETVDEEIIEDSPTKRKKSKLKIQSLKLKKNSSGKFRDDISIKINLFSDTKISYANLSQCLPVDTSTQSKELYSKKELKSFSISENKGIRNSYEILPSLSLVDTERIVNNIPEEETEKIDTKRMVNNIPKEETEKIDASNEFQAQKKKLSKLVEGACNSNLSCNDETFYLLGERPKEKTEKNDTKRMVNNISKEETVKIDTSNGSQAQKRKLSKLVEETCNSNHSCNDETFYLLGERPKEKTEKNDTKRMVNNISKEETEKIDTSNGSQAQKRKLSKLVEETCNSNLSCNDETFDLLGERLKEKSTSKVDNTKISNFNMPKNMSHDSPSMKKNLMNNFDVASKKENVLIDKTRNKAERAKMAGSTCWECEKYYGNLGLSKEEMKTRQKQCSRHRINKEKPRSPEGFWYPLFPEPYASSIEND
ncbi:uncharacterized protein LOC117220878 [Megalopta genalis]|uniref:uncharacterized protein LOC117220878 n=1 Tax=Megalopta genalis TaxID=115081 RepID=UPI003FD2F204